MATTAEVPSELISLIAKDIAAKCVEIDLGHGHKYVVIQLSKSEELDPFLQHWSELSARCADPNAYYSPWFFLPAAKHLPEAPDWRILLIWRVNRGAGNVPVLCGFFPLTQHFRWRTGRVWSLWAHPYCFLTSPLIEKGHEANVWESVLRYVKQQHPRVAAIECPLLAGEGALYHGAVQALRDCLSTTFVADLYLRATTPYIADTDELLKTSIAGHHLREMRRLRRKLESQGQLEYRSLTSLRGVETWIDWFLELEAAGWKSQEGTAIRQREEDTRFFREMIQRGLELNEVVIEGLFLNGSPIALKVTLISPPAAFAFKIAFDETLGKFSPGIQLELESMQRFGQQSEVTWADSCAAPGHPMIDRIWSERRVIQHLIISTGRGWSDVVWGARPLVRACYRTLKRCLQKVTQFRRRGTGRVSS